MVTDETVEILLECIEGLSTLEITYIDIDHVRI